MVLYSNKELENLENWRGVLSLLVLFSHAGQILWFPLLGKEHIVSNIILNIANISVVCFFVLSGMLISYSGLNLVNNSGFNWKKYLVNRITRIYPSYISILLICVVLVGLFSLINHGDLLIHENDADKYVVRSVFSIDSNMVIKSLFMINPGITSINGPLWSLFIEWWLYISAMFVFMLKHSKTFGIRIIFSLMAIISLMFAYYGFGIKAIYYILIWYIGFNYTIYFKENNIANKFMLFSSILVLTVIILKGGLESINVESSNVRLNGLCQIIYAILFIPISLNFTRRVSFLMCAKYSYTLYILHFPLMLFLYAIFKSWSNNNVTLLIIETLIFVCAAIYFSSLLAKLTEDKVRIRNYLFRKFAI